MKVIAFYLPQFHEIEENNIWWGKGFTEWTNVKRAKPLFYGHHQPRVPQNNNYYNLLDAGVMEHQVSLAKHYGIYAFCFYHYWFAGKRLLEKPLEAFLKNKTLKMPFCICWANDSWTNGWVSKSNEVLIKQEYGDVSLWRQHYNCLRNFFLDERYMLINNKPLFIIYNPSDITLIKPMLDFFVENALRDGFDGITFAYQYYVSCPDIFRKYFDFDIQFQPVYAMLVSHNPFQRFKNILRATDRQIQKVCGRSLSEFVITKLRTYEYDDIWDKILHMFPDDEKSIPGAVVDWDNTPRRGKNGKVFLNVTPEKFEKYMTKQIMRTRDLYKKDMLFLTAWNEWGEGAYMEPDELNKDHYLQALRRALMSTNEFPFEQI